MQAITQLLSIWGNVHLMHSLRTCAEAGGQVQNGRPLPSVRRELLRLKTSLRGLEVPSSEDFDEEVYAEAAEAVVAAASGVANVSGRVT